MKDMLIAIASKHEEKKKTSPSPSKDRGLDFLMNNIINFSVEYATVQLPLIMLFLNPSFVRNKSQQLAVLIEFQYQTAILYK
ncbi:MULTISPECIES: hypothetical protein [unclassified Peribacillus]|uniref:hypothetical protein n=1 Tax=unclassified Peribacillus TaxID=2675266 RepID=UPI00366B25F5